jgi:uncharacterized protein (UPF0254 family)
MILLCYGVWFCITECFLFLFLGRTIMISAIGFREEDEKE